MRALVADEAPPRGVALLALLHGLAALDAASLCACAAVCREWRAAAREAARAAARRVARAPAALPSPLRRAVELGAACGDVRRAGGQAEAEGEAEAPQLRLLGELEDDAHAVLPEPLGRPGPGGVAGELPLAAWRNSHAFAALLAAGAREAAALGRRHRAPAGCGIGGWQVFARLVRCGQLRRQQLRGARTDARRVGVLLRAQDDLFEPALCVLPAAGAWAGQLVLLGMRLKRSLVRLEEGRWVHALTVSGRALGGALLGHVRHHLTRVTGPVSSGGLAEEDAALPCFRLEWHGVQSEDGCPYTDASQLASQLFVLQGKGGGMDPACPCAVCSAWRAAGRPRFQAGRLEAPSVDGEDLRHAVSGFGGALAMDCFTRVAQP